MRKRFWMRCRAGHTSWISGTAPLQGGNPFHACRKKKRCHIYWYCVYNIRDCMAYMQMMDDTQRRSCFILAHTSSSITKKSNLKTERSTLVTQKPPTGLSSSSCWREREGKKALLFNFSVKSFFFLSFSSSPLFFFNNARKSTIRLFMCRRKVCPSL